MDEALMKKLRIAYNQHRKNVNRGRTDKNGNAIHFKLSFEDWADIWLASGKFELRGNIRGSYCMSRVNDVGHYEVGNVFIQSNADNIKQANVNARPCTLDGITIYPSATALSRAHGRGKYGTRSPNFRYV